jgi:ParB-like chromosome segregation protein Spo0J
MREDGFTQPIVCVDDPDNPGKLLVVDGEHRWRCSPTMTLSDEDHDRLCRGLDDGSLALPLRVEGGHLLDHAGTEVGPVTPVEVPVVVVPMTPEQARIATLRHNRARGSEDIELSAQVLRDLRELGALEWAQDSLMLDDAEVQALLDDIPAPEALAADEYSESWEPTQADPDDDPDAAPSETIAIRSGIGGDYAAAGTSSAIEAQRERERALREAKTEEEREAARRDNRIYRISLIFQGDESEVVKKVLGEQPAVRLLALCKEIAARQQAAPAG